MYTGASLVSTTNTTNSNDDETRQDKNYITTDGEKEAEGRNEYGTKDCIETTTHEHTGWFPFTKDCIFGDLNDNEKDENNNDEYDDCYHNNNNNNDDNEDEDEKKHDGNGRSGDQGWDEWLKIPLEYDQIQCENESDINVKKGMSFSFASVRIS